MSELVAKPPGYQITKSPQSPVSLVEIEIPRRFGDWFLARLLQRLFEPSRQRVAPSFFVVDRLLENGLAARCLVRENALRFAELGFIAAIRFDMRHDATEIDVDDERRLTAGARHFDFGLEPRHQHFPQSALAKPLAR